MHPTHKSKMMEDIAIATGGQYLTSEKGNRLLDLEPDFIGVASKIECDRLSTTIIDGKGNNEKIENRIAELRDSLGHESSDDEFINNRIARFTGGSAVVRAGGVSSIEKMEIYDRIEDAICAVNAAIKDGIVMGAGMMLVSASDQLTFIESENDDILAGVDIVFHALTKPASIILANAGINKEESLFNFEYGNGINALTGDECDLFKEGIIDPTKVVLCALDNAAAAAKSFIMTECIIIDDED
jgi:chaperonin GroEL